MTKTATPWSVPVAVDDVPDDGLHIEIEAPADIRAEVAKLAAVREIPQLSAVFDLVRFGSGVHVAGQVGARVGQTCVVSLEPLETAVEEPVDVTFVPAAAAELPVGVQEHTMGEPEPPEPLIDGKVDLGALATEFVLLGIDPYPRKPDAKLAAIKIEDGGAGPFAALEALKKPPGGGQK